MEGESGRQDLDSPSNVKWLTFAELADEQCSNYMSIGVPYNEYWYGDYSQLAHYAKAFELKRERANHDAWLQGAYIYDAFCLASPLLHAFAKKGTKPIPYPDKPYEAKKQADPKTAKAEFLARWKADKARWKAKKGGELDGADN